LWSIDPDGKRPARRLTRSQAGEAELILKRAGGIWAFAVARGSGRLVIGTHVMPGAEWKRPELL
jgi:hypothetical protein